MSVKYLTFKEKYFNLKKQKGGCSEIENSEIIYTINFLWLNRNLVDSYSNQKYMFIFDNIYIEEISKKIINLDKISNIINIIKWVQLNPKAEINIWHDCSTNMVNNTNKLITFLYNNPELIENIEIVNKIIKYKEKLLSLNKYIIYNFEREDLIKNINERDMILTDEIINIYLNITMIPKKDSEILIIERIEYTQDFIDKINMINSYIRYFDDPSDRKRFGLIGYKKIPELNSLIFFKSIITLDKLREVIRIEEYGKFIDLYPLEYFGLKSNGTLSRNDNIPVYFKVDLVRLIILLQLITENPNSYAIYADLDTTPLSEDMIFTEESIQLLNNYGLVLPKGQLSRYENSFHILAGEALTSDLYMRISIEKILVDFNIYKILNNYNVKPQDVFGNYKDMFLFYFAVCDDKLIQFNYPPSFVNLRLDYPRDKQGYPLDKEKLLNLDMEKVARGYTHRSNGPNARVGLQLFDFYTERFELIYPIREDLAKISPHHYNYDKKYLLYK